MYELCSEPILLSLSEPQLYYQTSLKTGEANTGHILSASENLYESVLNY